MNEPEFHIRPFHISIHNSKVYDMNKNIVFEFINVSKQEQTEILYKLNSIVEDTEKISDYNPIIYSPSTSIITRKHGERFIIIRGWSNLISNYEFSLEKASKIQKNLGNWLVKKLSS